MNDCYLNALIKIMKFKSIGTCFGDAVFMLVASHLREEKTPVLDLKAEAAGSTPREIHLACFLLRIQRD